MDKKLVLKRLLGVPKEVTLDRFTLLLTLSSKWEHLIYKNKYGTEELVNKMCSMGLKEGSCVFIHSSWGAFYNYKGTEKDLIEGILKVIGPTGTLAMPSFPLRKDKIFNVKRTVTGAGLLAEAFRRYPGVKRSINVQHSVCALGPLSDYLLSEHHLGETCWDEKSPYFRLSEVNAVIFTLGLGYSFMGTVIHCVETMNRKNIPYYSDFFTKEKLTHKYIDYDGEEKTYQCYDIAVNRKFKLMPESFFLRRHFTNQEHKKSRISNLTIHSYYAEKYIPRLIELGRKGIDVYKSPSKKGYTFEK